MKNIGLGAKVLCSSLVTRRYSYGSSAPATSRSHVTQVTWSSPVPSEPPVASRHRPVLVLVLVQVQVLFISSVSYVIAEPVKICLEGRASSHCIVQDNRPNPHPCYPGTPHPSHLNLHLRPRGTSSTQRIVPVMITIHRGYLQFDRQFRQFGE